MAELVVDNIEKWFRREDGQPFKLDSGKPTIPVADFMAAETRFAVLQRTQPERAAELAALAGVEPGKVRAWEAQGYLGETGGGQGADGTVRPAIYGFEQAERQCVDVGLGADVESQCLFRRRIAGDVGGHGCRLGPRFATNEFGHAEIDDT